MFSLKDQDAAKSNGHGLSADAAEQLGEEDVKRLAEQDLRVSAAFARVVSILMRDAKYKQRPLADLEWLIVPPVLLRKFAILDEQVPGLPLPVPAAVALWASVSDDVDRKLTESSGKSVRLAGPEWDSGPHLWVVEMAGDPAAIPQLLTLLRNGPLEGREPKIRTV